MRATLICITLLSSGLAIPLPALAWDCAYEKDISQTLDLSSSEELAVLAAAGDLEIRGKAGTSTATITGKVCASKESWLADAQVLAKGGKQAEIAVELPDTDSGWSVFGNKYVYLDLVLEVPADIPLDVKDSSGDIGIDGTAAVDVKDSSGDITISKTSGPVSVRDSSGDVRLAHIGGDLTIASDSSGDVRAEDVRGSVLVQQDSSGDLSFSDVQHDVIVEQDSSGDISARRVGGAFRVLRDGSGEISSRDVKGEVDIPKDKS